MSTIIKTEAIVLKSIKFRETSKIVTFFTKELGKISGILKGVRNSKIMYGTALEPMAHVAIVLYEKKGRDVQTVTACETVRRFRKLFEDLDTMVIGLSVVELVRDVAHEEEKNVPLFDLLAGTLSALEGATRYPMNLFYSFEIHLARILGFRMIFDRCLSCHTVMFQEGMETGKIGFHLERGAPLCGQCSSMDGQKTTVSVQSLRLLDHFARETDIGKAANVKIDRKSAGEIESVLWSFLRYHVSGIRTLKSRKVHLMLARK